MLDHLYNIRPNFNSLCSHIFIFKSTAFTKTERKIFRAGNGGGGVPSRRRVLKKFPHTMQYFIKWPIRCNCSSLKSSLHSVQTMATNIKKDSSSICWRWEDTLSKTYQLVLGPPIESIRQFLLSNPFSVLTRALLIVSAFPYAKNLESRYLAVTLHLSSHQNLILMSICSFYT